MIFRVLTLIASGYNPNFSSIMEDRFSEYKSIQL